MDSNPGKRVPAARRKMIAALLMAGCLSAAWAFDAPGDGVFKERVDWGLMMDMTGPASANEVPWV